MFHYKTKVHKYNNSKTVYSYIFQSESHLRDTIKLIYNNYQAGKSGDSACNHNDSINIREESVKYQTFSSLFCNTQYKITVLYTSCWTVSILITDYKISFNVCESIEEIVNNMNTIFTVNLKTYYTCCIKTLALISVLIHIMQV